VHSMWGLRDRMPPARSEAGA